MAVTIVVTGCGQINFTGSFGVPGSDKTSTSSAERSTSESEINNTVITTTTDPTGNATNTPSNITGDGLSNNANEGLTNVTVANSPTGSEGVSANSSNSNNGFTGNGQTSTNAMVPPAVGNLVPQIFQVQPGQVALTFDDGPGPYTTQIVATLQKYHVHGTFFFVGNRMAAWHQSAEAAIAAGDAVGDHSLNHGLLTNMTLNQQTTEVVDGVYDIQQYVHQPMTMFRPPYGAYNEWTQEVLQKNHMALALWNRDPRDWEAKTPAQIVANVLSDHPSGGIFDLHDTYNTLQALPAIIEGLQKQGLQFVIMEPPSSVTGLTAAGQTPAGNPPPSQGSTGNTTTAGTNPPGNQESGNSTGNTSNTTTNNRT